MRQKTSFRSLDMEVEARAALLHHVGRRAAQDGLRGRGTNTAGIIRTVSRGPRKTRFSKYRYIWNFAWASQIGRTYGKGRLGWKPARGAMARDGNLHV